MSELKIEILFQTTLTQKEFSMVTRTLAGHPLREEEKKPAQELNQRLLKLRQSQVRQYLEQATHALKMALQEQYPALYKSAADDLQPGMWVQWWIFKHVGPQHGEVLDFIDSDTVRIAPFESGVFATSVEIPRNKLSIISDPRG
jgi:hypothetical protein